MNVSSDPVPVWKQLGDPLPASLVDARLQLHHAAQVAVSVGLTFVQPAKDDSHTNLEWIDSLGALMSKRSTGDKPFHAALDIANFRLLLIDGTDSRTIFSHFDLDGQNIESAYAWLESAIEGLIGGKMEKDVVRSSNETPLILSPTANGSPSRRARPSARSPAGLRTSTASCERSSSKHPTLPPCAVGRTTSISRLSSSSNPRKGAIPAAPSESGCRRATENTPSPIST